MATASTTTTAVAQKASPKPPPIWHSCIPLQVTDAVRKVEIPNQDTISAKDICSFIKQNQKYHGWRVYFDKKLYAENTKETVVKLEEYIIATAKLNGTVLHKGGATTGGRKKGSKKTHRLNCCYQKYDQRSKRGPDDDFVMCRFRLQLEWDDTHGAWYMPIHCRMMPHHTCRKEGRMHDPTKPKPPRKRRTKKEMMEARAAAAAAAGSDGQKKQSGAQQADVLNDKNDENDENDEPLVAGDLAQIFEQGAVADINASVSSTNATSTAGRKRSYLDAYQILNPLLVEMLNIANADPSKLPYFRDVMEKAISDTQPRRNGSSPETKRPRTS